MEALEMDRHGVRGVREAALSECVRLKKIAELVVNRGNRCWEPEKEDEPEKNGQYEGGDNDGALVTADPYPEQNFFRRSDNYQLAKKGVVAQTVSAWAMPPTYHQPTDDLAHIDLPFMARVIQSMAGPVDWLLNSDFRPAWNPGGKP